MITSFLHNIYIYIILINLCSIHVYNIYIYTQILYSYVNIRIHLCMLVIYAYLYIYYLFIAYLYIILYIYVYLYIIIHQQYIINVPFKFQTSYALMKGFTSSRSTGIHLPDMREWYLSSKVNFGQRFAEDPRKTRWHPLYSITVGKEN